MKHSFTTTEKILLTAIVVVVTAIVTTIYWGVSLWKQGIIQTPYTNIHTKKKEDAPDFPTDNKVKNQNPALTEEDKLSVLHNLHRDTSQRSKEERLEMMKNSGVSPSQKSTLSVQEKMDILSGL